MGVKGTAELSHELARHNVDSKAVELWLVLCDLYDCGGDFVRKDDADLWTALSRHLAVQRNLDSENG